MTVSTTTLFGNVLLVELKAALEKQKGMKVKAIPCCFLQEDKRLEFSIQKVLYQNSAVQVWTLPSTLKSVRTAAKRQYLENNALDLRSDLMGHQNIDAGSTTPF